MGDENYQILTDCDGVLLDWAAGFGAWASMMFGVPWRHPEAPAACCELTPNNAHSWLRDAYGLSSEAIAHVIPAFQISEFFGHLPAYLDASIWVPRIVRDFGVKFVLVSSPGREPRTLSMRQRNLLGCFGDIFSSFTHLPALSCKLDALSEHPSSFWFDDHAPHVIAGHTVGHRAYHFDRFGEINPDVPNRVSGWGDVHALLEAHPPHSWRTLSTGQVSA